MKRSEKMNNKGKIYEEKAKKFLIEQGIKILDRNFYSKYGEIDIIVEDGENIVFIEVKYRKNLNFGFPEESIDKRKRGKILKTANYYLKVKKLENKKVRFDSILFLDKKIKWIKNIFWGDEI